MVQHWLGVFDEEHVRRETLSKCRSVDFRTNFLACREASIEEVHISEIDMHVIRERLGVPSPHTRAIP